MTVCQYQWLVRYGVAADHQGTKAMIRQYARLFEKQCVVSAGNLSVGSTSTLDLSETALQEMFDVVVLATGLSQDQRLSLAGESLPQVYGPGSMTRNWNDHPEEQEWAPAFGQKVVVVGNSNVAIDVVRFLAKRTYDFEASDLYLSIVVNGISEINIVGRSSVHLAKFDPVMIRELGKINGLKIRLYALLSQLTQNKRLLALCETSAVANRKAPTTVLTFYFSWQPMALERCKITLSGLVLQSGAGGKKPFIAIA